MTRPLLGILAFVVFFAAGGCSRSGDAAEVPRKVAVHAARMLDVKTGEYRADPLILIDGDKITAVTSGKSPPQGVTLIELGDLTLMPGLIDAHTHITYHFDENGMFGASGDASNDITLKYSEENARKTVEAGFTTIRNLGAGGRVDLKLRDLIANGTVPGPRIVASG